VVQVVKCLPSKHEALYSIPCAKKVKERSGERNIFTEMRLKII
jgi:hypothetical protein